MDQRVKEVRNQLNDEDRALFDAELADLKAEGATPGHILEWAEEWADRNRGVPCIICDPIPSTSGF